MAKMKGYGFLVYCFISLAFPQKTPTSKKIIKKQKKKTVKENGRKRLEKYRNKETCRYRLK
jgi:hypothetical protein